MKNFEELNCSVVFVGHPSSDFVFSEEEMIECLNRRDKVMVEKEDYARVTRKKCEDIRPKDLGKYRELIKREGN